MDTKSFFQIEINAVFTTTSGKMQFRSGVFDHFKSRSLPLFIVRVKCAGHTVRFPINLKNVGQLNQTKKKEEKDKIVGIFFCLKKSRQISVCFASDNKVCSLFIVHLPPSQPLTERL
jgi:hypothetical protein